MPTIDGLPGATASADTDVLLISQGGNARRATRSQLLAGVQPALALTAGQILGRTGTPGLPQPITVGANLTLSNSVLSGNVAPFAINGLASAAAPGPSDLVAVGQGGVNKAAYYAQFMSGISNVAGVSAAAMVATSSGAKASRLLADHFSDYVTAEDFGATGDGTTDDTAALSMAVMAGQPVRLGPKTYVVNGQWTLSGPSAVLIGIPGRTVLRRANQAGAGGAWISIGSGAFRAQGITFDANPAIRSDNWGILVASGCLAADFYRCAFANARGATLGSGLVFQASDPALTQHTVQNCEAYGNAVHGIWVQAVNGVLVSGSRAHDNGSYGICVDFADPLLVQKLRWCQVTECSAWNNTRGISVGNYNAMNSTPAVWGNANPDAIGILVAHNTCHDNTVYGIAVAGQYLTVAHNTLSNNGPASGAGLLCSAGYSSIAGNVVTGGSLYGIDAGGCLNTDISNNHVVGAVHGITPGGGVNVRVSSNVVQDCTGWSILVNNVETDGAGHNFGVSCTNLAIIDNWIAFSVAGGGGGVLLLDNPQNVQIARNTMVGSGAALISQALWANTNSLGVEGNTWNFSPVSVVATSIVNGLTQLLFPDILDRIQVNASNGTVQTIKSLRAAALTGQISFVAVTSGGIGYSSAAVTITGDGSGAAAIPFISNGVVIGVAMTASGAGYTTATVVISGNGAGATGSAQIGLPVLEQRHLVVRPEVPMTFGRAATSSPQQINWTGYDFTVPAMAEITFLGRAGTWRAGSPPLADYVLPDGTGGLGLTTVNGGDLVLRPTGHLRIATAAEPAGITHLIGRGSPTGIVSALPGSDYRNLNGGVGSTFWVKQTGTGSSGWIALG